MFFNENNITLELLGVFRINRKQISPQKSVKRIYDSLSIRLSGKARFSTENKDYTVDDSDLLYMPSHQEFNQRTDGETIVAIHFINYSYSPINSIEVFHCSNIDEVRTIVTKMYKIWNEKNQGYKHECTALLYHLLYLISQQIHEETISNVSPQKMILNAVNYIHKNYRKENISISKLANISFVSEVYFRKIFKSIYNISPNKYIVNLRLEYAAQLLSSGFFSVSEVSEKSGFNSSKYFERAFKKKYEKTPSEYRKIDIEKLFK